VRSHLSLEHTFFCFHVLQHWMYCSYVLKVLAATQHTHHCRAEAILNVNGVMEGSLLVSTLC